MLLFSLGKNTDSRRNTKKQRIKAPRITDLSYICSPQFIKHHHRLCSRNELIALVGAFAFSAMTAFAQGVMTFDQTEHNFGKFPEEKPQTYTFKFKNTGDRPFVIKQASLLAVAPFLPTRRNPSLPVSVVKSRWFTTVVASTPASSPSDHRAQRRFQRNRASVHQGRHASRQRSQYKQVN